MKTANMARTAYETTYGPIGRGGARSADTLAVWDKVKKLPLVEYLILEPEKGEKSEKLRSAWYTRLKKMADMTHANFTVRLALNKLEGHVVVWKEPKGS